MTEQIAQDVPPTKRSSRRRPPTDAGELEPTALASSSDAVVSPAPEPPAVFPTAPLPQPPPSPDVIPGTTLRKHDVVQIIDPKSRHYGQFIMVGDMTRGKVHGYYMCEGHHKEFVTVDAVYCWHVGSAKVRAQVCCSPKWISDNRPS